VSQIAWMQTDVDLYIGVGCVCVDSESFYRFRA